MSTPRKIQIALGTILLWSSTSVSSFAATNTITPGTFQSDTVKLPVESIPSRQLNLTPDTYLIAQMDLGGILRSLDSRGVYRDKFEEAWKQPDRKTKLLDLCKSQPPEGNVSRCTSVLKLWLMVQTDKFEESGDYDSLDATYDIMRAI
jgi:hypothetical protein